MKSNTASWQFIEPQLSALRIPELADSVHVVLARVGDYTDQLLPDEAIELKKMAPVRQRGYATARYCAQLGQIAMQRHPGPVLREGRVPVWPDGLRGSISHADQIAGAALIAQAQGSIGIDIEALGRVDQKLFKTLFNPAEQAHVHAHSTRLDAATVLFSAKEALYKAVYPLVGRFIGFLEVEVHLDLQKQQFNARYIGEHQENAVMDGGKGWWRVDQGHVLTAFHLPGVFAEFETSSRNADDASSLRHPSGSQP